MMTVFYFTVSHRGSIPEKGAYLIFVCDLKLLGRRALLFIVLVGFFKVGFVFRKTMILKKAYGFFAPSTMAHLYAGEFLVRKKTAARNTVYMEEWNREIKLCCFRWLLCFFFLFSVFY